MSLTETVLISHPAQTAAALGAPPFTGDPTGIAFFFHGRNQVATWMDRSKLYFWVEMARRGVVCVALKSAGEKWEMGPDGVDQIPTWEIMEAIRVRYGLQDAPAHYFGFSSGTGPASLYGVHDILRPEGARTANITLFCGPGAVSYAEAQLPGLTHDFSFVFAFSGKKDRIMDFEEMQIARDRWKKLLGPHCHTFLARDETHRVTETNREAVLAALKLPPLTQAA
jgi:hypothetical protein